MNRLDYELGFASADGDWNNADGLGAAKAVLVACNSKCAIAHPFSRTKRDACKGKCQAAYTAKVNYINSQVSATTAATTAALTQQTGGSTQVCPQGMTAYGDGSACRDTAGNSCALWGNESKPRCAGYVPPTVATIPKTGGALPMPPATISSEVRTKEGVVEEKKSGLGTGAMIGIGVGAIVLILGAVYMLKRKK